MVKPIDVFHAKFYLLHNQKRLAHLESLKLPIAGKSVLEVGAGIGDMTKFFIDKRCNIVSTEGRPECVEILKTNLPGIEVRQLDMEKPVLDEWNKFDIVFCYGTLYHLGKPSKAIEFMSKKCSDMLLLETCVSPGDGEDINACKEGNDPSQSLSGIGCRPFRGWIVRELKKYFPFVYVTKTQPDHYEFPEDWTVNPKTVLTRSVFVASRTDLKNEFLTKEIPDKQKRFK